MRVLTITACLILLGWQALAQSAVPDFEKLATAIYKAEGGAKTSHPYGIMQTYKHTTPRQACLNTLHHQYSLYLLLQPRGEATEKGFLRHLQGVYAPVGAENDPKGLNANWLTNVRWFYDHS